MIILGKRKNPFKRKIKVLFVDDSRGYLKLINSFVESSSIHAYYAMDVKQALDVLDQEDIQAVCTDYTLVTETGNDVRRACTDADPEIPIFLLTAHDIDSEYAKEKFSSFIKVFSKPSKTIQWHQVIDYITEYVYTLDNNE